MFKKQEQTIITETELNRLIQYGKPSNSIAGKTSKPLYSLPWRIVKDELPQLLQAGEIDRVIEIVMRHQFEDFNADDAKDNEAIYFMLWVRKGLEQIAALEEAYLQSEPDPKMIAAGIASLNEFGSDIQIDQLAGGDILKWAAIKELPYELLFGKLKMEKANRAVEKRYSEIINKK